MLTLLLACREPADTGKPPAPADDTAVLTDSGESVPTPTDSDSTATGDDTGTPTDTATGCADRADNDGDGWSDAADPDCATGAEVGYGATACNDGTDNDLDGAVDARDDDCDDAWDDEGERGLVGDIAVGGAEGTWEGDVADSGFGGLLEVVDDLDGDGADELFAVGSVALRARFWWLSPPLTGGNASDARAEVYGIDASLESARAGDVDGDGVTDLVVGAPAGAGAVWILPGGPVAGANPVDDLPDRLDGAEDAGAGARLWWGADLDGDGAGDLIVGASNVGTLGAVVVPGPLTPGVGTLEDAPVKVFHREIEDGTGAGLAAGDLDGDGFDDLLLGAPGADADHADHGRVYALLGPLPEGSASVRVAVAEWVGEEDHHSVGREVRLLGDVDGDGRPDVLVGTGNSADPTFAGRAYLLYEPASGGERSLAEASVQLEGEASGDRVGVGLGALGDVDADGRADLAVAASLADRAGEDAGVVYLFYGSLAPGAYTCDRAHGTVLGDVPFGQAGAAVAGGRLDADDHADLAVGAPAADRGRVYVFAGKDR